MADCTCPDSSWLQAKVEAQRKALDALHTRVVNQRFQLRTINELGRGLTADEFALARKQLGNTEVADRMGSEMLHS